MCVGVRVCLLGYISVHTKEKQQDRVLIAAGSATLLSNKTFCPYLKGGSLSPRVVFKLCTDNE